MVNPMRQTDASGGLVEIIHQVRRRWRYKLALRGAVGVLGLGVAVLLLSAYGLESWRFSAGSIVAFRVLLGVALTGAGRLVPGPAADAAGHRRAGRALHRRARALAPGSDRQRHRGREGEPDASVQSPHSAALVQRLVETAVEKCQAIEVGRSLERAPVRRYAGTSWRLPPRRSRSSCSGRPICATRSRRWS